MTTSDGVQEAVDRLGATLGRAVLVEDPRHRPLWWSRQGTVDATRMRTILEREVHPAAIAMVARLGLARATGPVRVPAVPEAEMLARWCLPLRGGRDLLGYLWVLDPDHTVTEVDLLVECADVAAAHLARQRSAGDGRTHRRAALLALLAAGEDPDAARELIRLEALDPASTVVVTAPPHGRGWELPGRMRVHLAGSGTVRATSGPPLPLAQLHVAVRRASAVQRVLRAGGTLAHPSWDALGGWHLIVAAPDSLAVADVHPGAPALAALDRGDLLLTARALLDAGGDVTRTAERLHIHRTTLYYRIERIEAVTGVNLRTGADRDDLHLALRLEAYRNAG
ncbi:PucR family transcriptional regulator [Jatrophihabitans sp.]|uniref:PucR family transcriptional regulator n=1 Tax=Jatrophihabitans sp. TaxID=1932789 RepID=UPI002B6080ED|nr:helix-turn-helix domain-containing protein [Jatrophihabitans sp.]